MNIFVIPSWYPSTDNPIAGIFFKEQTLGLGLKTHHHYIISSWGHAQYALPFNNPLKLLRNVVAFKKAQKRWSKIGQNVWEIHRPTLEWNQRIFLGNIEGLLQTNRDNFLEAQKKFGRIDLIHAYVSYPAGYLAMELAAEFKIPYVISEVVEHSPQISFAYNQEVLKKVTVAMAQIDQMIAISPALREQMKKRGTESVAIPFMVDEKFFQPALKPSADKFIFFSLANIHPEKGIEELLRAMAIVVKKNQNVYLRIGGQGEFLKTYQQLAQDLGIANHLCFLGLLSRQKAKKEFQRSDGFILASQHETFGVVYIEALACGKPIIATACGGPETIVTKDNGLLVPVGNAKKIAQAMLRLADDRNRYRAKTIRADFLGRFSRKAVAKQINDLYIEVLKEYHRD